jgi:hypothetical protein
MRLADSKFKEQESKLNWKMSSGLSKTKTGCTQTTHVLFIEYNVLHLQHMFRSMLRPSAGIRKQNFKYGT